MLKQTEEVETPPTCFGKLFDGSSPECMGGHDPAYYNPDNGSQIRDRCNYTSSCSGRMYANNKLVPASSLVRPPVAAAPHQATRFNSPTPAPTQNWQPPPFTPPHLRQQPQYAPNQLMSTNFGIPQYLTVREPQTGGSFGARLVRESFRSMLKSIGHTFANFFDTEIFGPGEQPPGGGAPPRG